MEQSLGDSLTIAPLLRLDRAWISSDTHNPDPKREKEKHSLMCAVTKFSYLGSGDMRESLFRSCSSDF